MHEYVRGKNLHAQDERRQAHSNPVPCGTQSQSVHRSALSTGNINVSSGVGLEDVLLHDADEGL